MVDDLLGIAGDWQPDLIVREAAELGATLIGACAGIPVACAARGAPMLDTAWGEHRWRWRPTPAGNSRFLGSA
jgi:hypothetical protein